MVVGVFPPVPGGTGSYVYELSKRLVKRGHQISVITRGSWMKSSSEEIEGVTVYRTRFIPLYPFHLHLHSFFVNRLLKSLEPNLDLIHLHNPSIPVIHTRLPVVVTQHGTVKGFIAHLSPRDMFSLVLKVFRRIYISIDCKVLNSADRIIPVSYSCAGELKAYYGIERGEVIHSAVDTSLFVPKEHGVSKTPSILYVGYLTTVKGVWDLVKSANYICREYPDIRFTLVGEGPFEKGLKRLVHHLNLDKYFSFIGRVSDQKRMVDYYQNATVHVLPSYSEGGSPIVVLEAMSCGIPTVATNVGGIPEAIVDGETGLLVPPKKPERLAQAVLKLLSDEELRRQMGEKARKRACEHYDWNIIASKIEEIYTFAL